MATDPICGMTVEESEDAITTEYEGRTYYFCAPGCKREFDEHPEKYVNRTGANEVTE